MGQGRAALAALYQEHATGLRRYALVILADPAAAEDVVQDAFYRVALVVESRDGFTPTIEYLRAAVRNACFSVRRRVQRRVGRSEAPLLEAQAPGASEEERLLLESALRTLPAEQREVVYLKVFEGMTFDEVAAVTGVGANTAASRFRYAMTALRRSLGAANEGI